MDAKRIISKVKEDKKESKNEKAFFLLVLNKDMKNKAIEVAKRNKISLSGYLRKCIEELIIQHQDNDQPRIDHWVTNSGFKTWPIPQHSITPQRFKGWNSKDIAEYKTAINRTLHALEQAEYYLDMVKSKRLDEPLEEGSGYDEIHHV